MNKLRIATIAVLAGSLLLPAAVYAQEDAPERSERGFRAAGEISGVVPGQGTFSLVTREGRELGFQTNGETNFRSPNGTVESIHDLKKGMKALVVAAEQDDGTLLALMVAAGNPDDLPDGKRLGGVIEAISLEAQSFTLKPRDGDAVRIEVGDRTKYRGEGIEALGDLEAGMHARVVVVEQDGGGLMALLVAAGQPKDRPDRPELDVKVAGEVVEKGDGSFILQTRDSERISFTVNEDTQYKGIGGLGELEVGMMAAVGANETDHGLLAVFVGARNPEDRPRREPQDHPEDRPEGRPDRRGPDQDQGQDHEVSA